MAREISCFLLTLSLVCKALSSYAQQPMQQYLHLTAVPQTVTIPAQNPPANQVIPNFGTSYANYPPTNQQIANSLLIGYNPAASQVITNPAPNCGVTNQSRPPTGLPSQSNLALPNLVTGVQQIREQPKPIEAANPSNIDAKLLNNLAIALQLLIVSNILNAPTADLTAKQGPNGVRTNPEPENRYPQYAQMMPNSNFIGTSNYAEPNLVHNYKPTRNSMSLMSPYEALGPSSPYSDPILSQFASPNPRKDFQSPYAMFDNDLFSMNDLY